MDTRERLLTGVALSLLACWEVGIGEIPLGLFSIRHTEQTNLFATIIVLKLLVASVLFSHRLLRLEGKTHRPSLMANEPTHTTRP